MDPDLLTPTLSTVPVSTHIRRTSLLSLVSVISSASGTNERQRLLSPSPTPSYSSITSSCEDVSPLSAETTPRANRRVQHGSPPPRPRRPSDNHCPATGDEHELRTRGEEMALMLANVTFTLVPLGLLTYATNWKSMRSHYQR